MDLTRLDPDIIREQHTWMNLLRGAGSPTVDYIEGVANVLLRSTVEGWWRYAPDNGMVWFGERGIVFLGRSVLPVAEDSRWMFVPWANVGLIEGDDDR